MTKITIPDDLPPITATIDDYYNTKGVPTDLGSDVRDRIKALERALDEIIMEATSRNHAIDIARRAREGGE